MNLNTSNVLIYGTETGIGSGSAAQLDANELKCGVTIKALASNPGNLYVGDADVTTSIGYPLDAGEEVSLNVDNTSLIFVVADSGSNGLRYIGA